MQHSKAEICILGGGPAGAVIGRRLAQLGHETVIIERGSRRQWPRLESFAAPILSILASLDLLEPIDAATVCRESRTLVRWESESISERSIAPPSFLVERCRFDRRLLELAAAAGARVLTPAKAQTPERKSSGGWMISMVTSDGLASIAADFVVDARGKRWSPTFERQGPRTATLSAVFDRTNDSYIESRIEAGTEQWFWGSPLRDGQYLATIFLDPRRISGSHAPERTELFNQLLASSELLGDLLYRDIVTPIVVRDATSGLAKDLIDEDFIRIGEAAFSIDPLSSQGVQRAILSAIQGAAAVHTLRSGHDSLAAMAFFRDRQQYAAARANLGAMRLYHTCLYNRNEFWMARARAVAGTTLQRQVTYEAPGSLPSFVRLSDALEIVEVPTLSGTIIKKAAALSHPRLEHPITYIGGIALAPLLADLVGSSATDQLLSCWTRRMPSEAACHIFRWMCALGILEACQGAQPILDDRKK